MKKILILAAAILAASTFSGCEKMEDGRLTTSVRCKAIAKSTGQQCKNMTYNASGYCHVHD